MAALDDSCVLCEVLPGPLDLQRYVDFVADDGSGAPLGPAPPAVRPSLTLAGNLVPSTHGRSTAPP